MTLTNMGNGQEKIKQLPSQNFISIDLIYLWQRCLFFITHMSVAKRSIGFEV
ncbi:hypothetical protein RchiOBHm_Chr1g0318321 [Rosa chinensis]|uniref:Uncharacterized protein n=1 Tax=Rosa chinensis TaxID=74649 RepID=A0A2P6S836_ROSCH|nr:hypothetical protein RchiOBHm_Chr1g0318321 [Rosa chinensis]